MLNVSFKLTSETEVAWNGETLYRIQAIRDIPARGIAKGDMGGFISTIEINCNARVSGDAWVYGDAQVSGDARVYGNAQVSGDAHIDSVDAIIVLVIAASYSVTITRKWIFAGCQAIKRVKVKSMTSDDFVKIGGKPEYFMPYKQMVLGAMKLVKPKAKSGK